MTNFNVGIELVKSSQKFDYEFVALHLMLDHSKGWKWLKLDKSYTHVET